MGQNDQNLSFHDQKKDFHPKNGVFLECVWIDWHRLVVAFLCCWRLLIFQQKNRWLKEGFARKVLPGIAIAGAIYGFRIPNDVKGAKVVKILGEWYYTPQT